MTCPDCEPWTLSCDTCHGTHEVDGWRLVIPWVVTALGIGALAWVMSWCPPARAQVSDVGLVAAERVSDDDLVADGATCDADLAREEAVCVALLDAVEAVPRSGLYSSPREPGRLPVCIELAHAAARAGLDPALVVALAWNESRLSPDAISPGGATGVLQVVPSQLRRFLQASQSSYSPWEPGLWTLSRWLARHPNPVVAVAAYNGGAVREERHYRYARAVVALARRIR